MYGFRLVLDCSVELDSPFYHHLCKNAETKKIFCLEDACMRENGVNYCETPIHGHFTFSVFSFTMFTVYGYVACDVDKAIQLQLQI